MVLLQILWERRWLPPKTRSLTSAGGTGQRMQRGGAMVDGDRQWPRMPSPDMLLQKAVAFRWLLAASRASSNLLARSPYCLAARAVVGANAGREHVSSASPVLDALAPLVLRQGATPHHPGENNFPVLQRGKVPRDFYANPHFHNSLSPKNFG